MRGRLGVALLLAGCSMSAGDETPQPDSWVDARERMVTEQLANRGVTDERVLAAMRRVPRHELVPERQRPHAYEDRPLRIGLGQTISQPYVVAAMSEAVALKGGEKVLEVGTGSGYQAAVLAELGASVYTIEIEPELAERARQDLERLGYQNVHVRAGDGYRGWPEEARHRTTCHPPCWSSWPSGAAWSCRSAISIRSSCCSARTRTACTDGA